MNFDQILSNFNTSIDRTYADLGANLQSTYQSQMQATVDQYMQQAKDKYKQMADSAIASYQSQLDGTKQSAYSQLNSVLSDMKKKGYNDSQIKSFENQMKSAIDSQLATTQQGIDDYANNLYTQLGIDPATLTSTTTSTTSTRPPSSTTSTTTTTTTIPTTPTSTSTSTKTPTTTTTTTSTTTSGPDINISFAQVEAIVTQLQKGLNSLKSNWTGVTNTNISKLEASWVGKDCQAYIEKVKNMDKKVNNTIAAIELLIKTYNTAINQIKQSQATVASTIANI